MGKYWIWAAVGLLVGACDRQGTSVREMKQAAFEKTRETLRLGPDAKLDATVFVGKKVDGKSTLCGFVRGSDGKGGEIDPREFAATTDPVEWLVFQSVHAASTKAQPGKFVTWTEVCGRRPRV